MNQRTILINIFGAPGTGKSTTAAGLVHKLKSAGIEAQLIGERYKYWALRKQRPTRSGTLVTIGEQIYDECIYYGLGNVIVSESPLEQNAFYYDFGASAGSVKIPEFYEAPMTKVILGMRRAEGHRVQQINYLLTRGAIRFEEHGRFETEQEASIMGNNLSEYLHQWDIQYQHILPDASHLFHRVVRDVLGALTLS